MDVVGREERVDRAAAQHFLVNQLERRLLRVAAVVQAAVTRGALLPAADADQAPGDVIVYRRRHPWRELDHVDLQRAVRRGVVEIARATTFRLGAVALLEEAIIPDDLLDQR